MKSSLAYGGWALSLVLLTVSGYLYLELQKVENREAMFQEGRRSMHEMARNIAKTEPSPADIQIESLRKQLDDLKRQLEQASAKPAQTEEVVPEPPSQEPPDAAESQPDDGGPSQGERMADAQMGMIADMAYQDLFNELSLPPDVRATVKNAVVASMTEARKATMKALQSNDQTAKQMHAQELDRKAVLRSELAALLTPEELAAWDDYEPVADQILYEKLVDGQLNMLASGLSSENRTLASQVMAEELVREFDAFNASEEIYTTTSYNHAQARALNASLERLSEVMDGEQYGHVEGFVNQALAMFDAMAEQ